MADTPTQRKSWLDVLAALTPLILGLLVTGVGALFTQVYNYRQLELNRLTALDKLRPLPTSEKPADREFAYASFIALGYEELALKMISLKQDGAGRAAALDISNSGAPAARATASELLASIPAQVYLHIGDESVRPLSDAVSAALSEAGLQPMGTENIAGKAGTPNQTQVRFFNEADRATAETIASLLRAQGVSGAIAADVASLKGRPGTLEVWFGKDVREP